MKKIVKACVKFVLSKLEVGVYNKKTAPRTCMAEAMQHIRRLGFNPKSVIDVGVAYGTYELYHSFPEANYVLVEPLEEYEPKLKKITAELKGNYVLAAAGDREQMITLHVHPDLSGSSLHQEAEGGQADGVPRSVPMRRLDEICEQYRLAGPVLLKIDAQGAEVTVLEGTGALLDQIDVIVLEVSLFEFYKGGAQFYDVVNWMKTHDFVAYDIFGGHLRPLDQALSQVDMVFVKTHGVFRRLHHYATPEQRKKHTENIMKHDPK